MKAEAHRIVLKVGSSSLNHPGGGLDEQAIERVVGLLAALTQDGVQCILVSSGAVAAGMGKLGLTVRPGDIAERQAVAAVGQGKLIEKYNEHLEKHGLIGAQVLLSRVDLADSVHYRNAQNTLEKLIKLQVIPIINENDTVVVEELCFGDNDRLSALVAGLVHADFLAIFTDVDGLYTGNPKHDSQARLIEEVRDITEVEEAAEGTDSGLGTGGMSTKLKAAQIATRFGIGVALLNNERIEAMKDFFKGQKPRGTYFHPLQHRLAGRKRWIAYAGLSEGEIQVDDGAARALREKGKSLLAKGIVAVAGNWERKDLVRIIDASGRELGRGIAELSSTEVEKVKGKHSEDMLKLLPDLTREEVIHRDNLTIAQEE